MGEETMGAEQGRSETWETILLAIDAGERVATLTLNRPQALNAISRQLATDLLAACDLLSRLEEVRAVIITGAGERAFCAGADLKERLGLSAAERADHTARIEAAAEALAMLPMPTIAAIRGYALAGGSELAIACDLRVASDDAVMGFPEVKVGIFPGAGGALRLPRIVGNGAARDLLFTGRQIAADEAMRIGLIDRMAAPDAVLSMANGAGIDDRAKRAAGGARGEAGAGRESGPVARGGPPPRQRPANVARWQPGL